MPKKGSPLTEPWKPIPGWDGYYEANSAGQIRSVERMVIRGGNPMRVAEKILKPSGKPDTYPKVNLSRAGAPTSRDVHVLIALTFHGPRPNRHEVLHRNGNKADSRAANLSYGTSSENSRDTVAHGNNPYSNRTHCPADHPLTAPNLVASEMEIGHRKCRACNSARAKIFRHPSLAPHFQAISDEYLARYMPALSLAN